MPSALENEAGDGGSDDASEIADEVLEAGPAASGGGARQSLRDGPEVGGGNAEEKYADKEGDGAVKRMICAGKGDEEPAETETTADEGFADQSERASGGNPTIGEPTRDKRCEGAKEISRASEFGHLVERESTFANKVVRQPGDEEIADVVIGEEAETGAPGGAQAQKFIEGGGSGGDRGRSGLVRGAPRHEEEPGHKPEEAGCTEDEEEGTPADMSDEKSAEEETEGGAEEESGAEDRVGEAALAVGEVEREDLAIGRVSNGFADAEDEAKGEQEFERVGEAGEGGSDGPEREAGGEDEVDVEPIDEPAGEKLGAGVGPEEGGEEEAEAGGGEAELVLEKGSRDGEITAVDIVDEDRESEKNEGDEEAGRNSRRGGEGRAHECGRNSAGRKGKQGGKRGRAIVNGGGQDATAGILRASLRIRGVRRD